MGNWGNAKKGRANLGVRNLEIARTFARKGLHNQSKLPEKLDCPMHMQGIPGGAKTGVWQPLDVDRADIQRDDHQKSRIVMNRKSGGKKRCSTYIRSHGLVDGSPPDLILRGLLLDDTLVGGRTTSLSTRVSSQGTAGSDGSSGFVDKSILIESRDSRVGNL